MQYMELTNFQVINLPPTLLGNNTETDVPASFTLKEFSLLTKQLGQQ